MYKNRKKILLVACTSVAVLAAFGAGSWAIVDSSNRIPSDNKIQSELAGATAYAGDFQFKLGKMSVDDWMFYNMPKYAVNVNQNDTNSSIQTIYYYGQNFKTDLATKGFTQKTFDDEINNLLYILRIDTEKNIQEVYTNSFNKEELGLKLVSSKFDKNEIINEYYWGKTETIKLAKDESSENSFSYSTTDKNKVTYSMTNASSGSGKAYKTSISSNTASDNWVRTFIPATGDNKGFSFEYKATTLTAANAPIKQNYTYINKKTNSNKEEEVYYDYYLINYTSGSNSTPISNIDQFKAIIKYNKNPTNGDLVSQVSTGLTFEYLPVLSTELFKTTA